MDDDSAPEVFVNPSSASPMSLEHFEIEANGQCFHVAAAGPASGPLVILLHGFPDFSYGWRHQMQPLAAAGFRVVAPDQRGCGYSSKPSGIFAYRIDILAADVMALVDALGRTAFSIVGHDWGGIVAWHIASTYPGRLDRLVIVNAPNLRVSLQHLAKSPIQLLKSSYVAWFQLPFMPELVLSAFDFRAIKTALRTSSRSGTFNDDELAIYREAWSQPGALTSMLNWYRALPIRGARGNAFVETRTLILWGDADTALDASLAEDCAALCTDVEVHHFPNATHWVHQEATDEVNTRLVDFLASSK